MNVPETTHSPGAHGMTQPDDMIAFAEVVQAVAAAWKEGCPVAGSTEEQRREIAQVALRRWRSFARRMPTADHAQRVRDLAAGLGANLHGGNLGPLREDYRFLANAIGKAIGDAEAAIYGNGPHLQHRPRAKETP